MNTKLLVAHTAELAQFIDRLTRARGSFISSESLEHSSDPRGKTKS